MKLRGKRCGVREKAGEKKAKQSRFRIPFEF